MINRDKAAQEAVSEVDNQIEGTLPGSDVQRAKTYIDQAITTLDEMSGGYDPETLASSQARTAAVEFAKAKLLGRSPHSYDPFIVESHKWSRTAAAKYYSNGHNIN